MDSPCFIYSSASGVWTRIGYIFISHYWLCFGTFVLWWLLLLLYFISNREFRVIHVVHASNKWQRHSTNGSPHQSTTIIWRSDEDEWRRERERDRNRYNTRQKIIPSISTAICMESIFDLKRHFHFDWLWARLLEESNGFRLSIGLWCRYRA